MKTVIEQLTDFINALESKPNGGPIRVYAPANLWLEDDSMRVYVRRGNRIIFPGKLSVTLDIGTVVVDDDKQGQGYWTNFIDEAHRLNPWEATFVELVHNPILSASLIRNGWFPSPESLTQAVGSFFMPKDTEKYFNQQFLQQKFAPKNREFRVY